MNYNCYAEDSKMTFWSISATPSHGVLMPPLPQGWLLRPVLPLTSSFMDTKPCLVLLRLPLCSGPTLASANTVFFRGSMTRLFADPAYAQVQSEVALVTQ